jgi:SAM-dependent methyltransferase
MANITYADEHLSCPKCAAAGRLLFTSDPPVLRSVVCGACGYELPVYDGIADFAEHIGLADPELSPAQKVMNSRLFAFFYETPVWRPLHTFLGSGISMNREVREILEMGMKGSEGVVADLACGTGHYARAFARRLPKAPVYGLDISPGMLQQGLKIASAEELDNITFLRGDIYRLPFPDSSVQNVNCCGALHLFSDVKPIWGEIARVLKPGGVFTAMTLARSKGIVRKLQIRAEERDRASFFAPEELCSDLSASGLSSFNCVRHRLSLLFSTTRM